MTMAVSVPPVFLLLSLLLCCQSSRPPDLSSPPSASPPSPSPAAHPHRHRHRHHHGERQPALVPGGDAARHEKDQVRDADAAQGGAVHLSRDGDEAGKGVRVERGGASQGVRETPTAASDGSEAVTRAMPLTPRSSTPAEDVSAKPAGRQESRHPPGRPDIPPHQSGPRRQRHPGGIPDQRSQNAPITALPSPSPGPLSANTTITTTTTRSPRSSPRGKVSDAPDGLFLPAADSQDHQKTSTERTTQDHADRQDEVEDAEDADTPGDAAVPEDSAEPSDEKLVNRPRWRYILRQHEEKDDNDNEHVDDDVYDNDYDDDEEEEEDDGVSEGGNPNPPSIKDNSSRNWPSNNNNTKDADLEPAPGEESPNPLPDSHLPDSPSDSPSDDPSDDPSDPDLTPKPWSHNRPRWDKSHRHRAQDSHQPRGLPDLTPPPAVAVGKQKSKPNAAGLPGGKGGRLKGEGKSKEVKKHNMAVVVKGERKGEEEDDDPPEAAGEWKKSVKKQKRKRKKSGKSRPLTKGCPGCTQAEREKVAARELHKQVLKAQLLDKLRLVPTFQRQPWPPKLPDQVFADEVQRDEGEDDDDRYYAKPTQLLLFGRDLGPRHRLKKAGTGSYKFVVQGRVKGAVRSARLWVYKMADANDAHEQTLVVTELHMSKRRRLRERSLVTRLDTHVQEGWVSFDVTQLVRRWVGPVRQTPAPHQLLAIRCKTCHQTNYRAIFGVKSHFRPVLVIRETEERQRHRKERSACDPSNGCCKFDMIVSFHELGIHEIFRPQTIKADYCFGSCERPDAYHYNHTMIMQHMRFNSHVQNVTMRQRLQPCCVPVVLREATIYHYLNSGLDSQVSLVPNLLVDRCGCA